MSYAAARAQGRSAETPLDASLLEPGVMLADRYRVRRHIGSGAFGVVVLVEDIVDSGRTMQKLIDLLATRRPRSLQICALLHKHIAEHLEHPVKFIGFDAPNEFLVGYGLDHAENFRHVPYIASLA